MKPGKKLHVAHEPQVGHLSAIVFSVGRKWTCIWMHFDLLQ